MLIVGELINTSRKSVQEAVAQKDEEFIRKLVKAQAEAGASYLDVNCGTFYETEVETIEWLVELVQAETTLPLCVDSPNPLVLKAALKKLKTGRPMINSINNETPRWNSVLPLVKEYNAKVIALCIEDAGMPNSKADRLRIADDMISKLTKEGIPLDDIYIDPLIMPVGAGEKNAIEVLDTVQELMQTYAGVHTICGLTNVSFNLPARKLLNRTFLIQAMIKGMDSFILDPTNREMRSAILASQALLGQDKFCKQYIKGFRQGLYE